jgi:hypothetical protein
MYLGFCSICGGLSASARVQLEVVRTSGKPKAIYDIERSCRCSLIRLQLATLSADEVQLGQHDNDQSGTECEVERVELDWDGHSRLIGLTLKELRDVRYSLVSEVVFVVGLDVRYHCYLEITAALYLTS